MLHCQLLKHFQIFLLYFLTIIKLTTKLFPWKQTPFKHHDKSRSRSKAQPNTIGMFVQQSEITDFIYQLVYDNFRMKRKYHRNIDSSRIQFLLSADSFLFLLITCTLFHIRLCFPWSKSLYLSTYETLGHADKNLHVCI